MIENEFTVTGSIENAFFNDARNGELRGRPKMQPLI